MTEVNPQLKIEKLEQTIQKLRERETRLRACVNVHAELCLIINRGGHISDIISNHGKLLPEESTSLIGQGLQNILPNMDGEVFLRELSLVVEGRETSKFVYEYDNHQFLVRLTPLHESHDSSKLVIVTIMHVSDQRLNMYQPVSKEISEKLIISHQLAFELLESIGEVFYGLDRDWCFIYLNQKAEQLWGRSRDDLIGKNIWEEFPQGIGTEAYRKMHRAFEDQCAVSFETFSSFQDAWVEVEIYPTMSGLSVYFHDRTRRKTAEEALQASEEQYRQIVNTAQEGIWIIDSENRTTFVNPQMGEMLGYSIEEMLGTSIFDYMDEEGQAITAKSIKSGGLKTKGLHDFSFTKKDGSKLYVLLSKTPLVDDTGTYTGALAMLVDMGDRKQASDAQAQLAAIVSSSGDAIISMTLEGIITSWNASAEEIYGYSAQEMLGKSIYTLIPPEGWDGEVVLLKQVASGEVVQNIEVSRLKKNDTDIFASITVSPMRDSQGNIIGVSKIARDITERQHILHQLQEREGTLALSLHAAHAGVWSWDIEGKRIVWDKQMERIHGLEPETFEGTYEAWRKTLHPEDINFAEQAIQDALSDSNPFNIEFRVVQPDGPIRHVLGQATVVRDDDGTPRKLIGVYIDITNRKQAEQEIRRLNTDLEQRVIERTREIALINQELEAFNYSVSHDLRTPLRALDGFSQAVLEDYGDIIDEEGKRYLERIRLASQRMSGLIDDLLKLSRVSRREMERANVNLSVITRGVASELETNDSNRSVQFVIQEGIWVQGDKNLLQIVMQNLLGNAWKFTNKKKTARIEFGMMIQDGESIFFVRDNGAGFNMAYVDKLFGAFQRLHSVTEFEGTGIGLATVQRIIHRHGGKVWTESIVNEGATFYFTLSE